MVGFGLVVLFLLNRSVLRRQVLEIGIFRTLGLVAVLAFSVPSVWEWANALLSLMRGVDVVNTGNVRYVLTALCMPWLAVLCVVRLFGWYRLQTVSVRAAKADNVEK